MGTTDTTRAVAPRRHRARILRIVGTAILACSVGLVALPAASPAGAVVPSSGGVPKRMMSGWLPYWTTASSVDAFVANADLFNDISPFWHNAAKSTSTPSRVTIQNNSLSSGSRASNLATLRGRGVAILPSITDGTGAGHLSSVMKSTTKRAAFVSQIVNLVTANGYDGIDLDFEKFAFSDGQSTWDATRPAWVAFVAALGSQLHARGKQLAVSVPPMGVAGNNYWVYDWAGIEPYIDKLRIMAYDYSWSTPGPIGGPLSWVEKVAAYAVSVLPPSKVQLGTPTYGRDWVKGTSGSGCPSTAQKVYDSKNIGTAISGVPESSWKRDGASQERYFNYTVTYGACRVSRSAWLPDAATVDARARIASKYGLNGIATWTIGGEQSSQWAPLREIARTLPFSAPDGPRGQAVSVKVSKKSGKKGRKVTIKGGVSPARAGVRIKLQVKKSGKWKTVNTVKTAGSGGYKTSVKQSAKRSVYRIKVVGTARYLTTYSGSFTVRAS